MQAPHTILQIEVTDRFSISSDEGCRMNFYMIYKKRKEFNPFPHEDIFYESNSKWQVTFENIVENKRFFSL